MIRPTHLVLVAALLPSTAWADDSSSDACVASFDASQKLRDDGKLLDARREAIACAQATCPDFVAEKCTAWVDEIDAVVPSVIVSVDGAAPTGEAVVRVDGEPTEEGLTGRPHELDPGRHVISVEIDGVAGPEQSVLVAQGEQNRKVVVELPGGADDDPAATPTEPVDQPAPEPTTADESAGMSPLFWTGLAVTGVGVGLGAAFGGIAMSRASDLESRCGGQQCPLDEQSEHDEITTFSHVSTAGFALAGAGAVLAVVGLVIGGDDGEGDAMALRVGPTGVVWGGAF